ncbi:hypothetical protein FRC19_006296 [Serendipita sp. 401]|nr:hypothetical protein FRC19_006296 [Serendipita sp. 401]
MKMAGLDPQSPSDRARCLFVDDSLSNVRGAKKEGWGSSVWFREKLSAEQRAHLVSGDEATAQSALRAPSGSFAEQLKQSMEASNETPTEGIDAVISNLHQLRETWPFLFKSSTNQDV